MLTTRLNKLIGIALLSLSVLLVGCGGKEDRADAYLEKAQQYFEEENYEKAKIEVKNVLQIDPNNLGARFLSGEIAEKEENFRGAFQNFSAVVQLNPNSVRALNKLTFYFIAAKQYDQAQENAEKALEIEPENSDTLSLLAIMYAQQEMMAEAEDFARRSLAQDPANVTAVTALVSALAEKNLDEALAVVNEGISNQPTDPSLKVLKIRVLQVMKDTADIPAIYQQLIDENPEDKNYVYRLAGFYMSEQDIPEAERAARAEALLRGEIAKNPENDQLKIWLVQLLARTTSVEVGMEALEQFVASSPDSETLRDSLASSYLATEKDDLAQALYLEVIEADPASVAAINARIKLVNIALKNNDKAEAERLIAEVLELDAENSDALIAKSKIRIVEAKYTEAIPDLRVVLKNQPDSVEALFLLATANEKTGSLELALDGYQTLLSVKKDNVPALLGAGRILTSNQEIETAQQLFESALALNPGNAEASRYLVTIYGQQKEWDKALSVSAQLIENERTIAMGYYLQGRIYLGQNKIKDAIKSLELSQQADDRIVESLNALINSYLATEQQDVAVKYLLKHVEKNPDHVNARELLAAVYTRTGNLDEATSILEELIAERPDNISSYRLLLSVYTQQKDVEAIDNLLQSGIKNSPDTLGLYILQADFYQQLGEVDKAIASYEVLLSKNPDALVAKNNLAAILLDYRMSGANLERAAELSNALAATEVPAFLDTAGWVQYKLENYPQALALLRLAVDKGGVAPVYQYHLGMAYYKNNMPAQAKEALTLAVAGEGDYPGKDEAVKTLNSL